MIERIASVKHKDGSITFKACFGEDFDSAEQVARDWLGTLQSPFEFIAIEYEEFFLMSVKHFVRRPAAEVVTHSRILSQEDREFLAGCLISTEGL